MPRLHEESGKQILETRDNQRGTTVINRSLNTRLAFRVPTVGSFSEPPASAGLDQLKPNHTYLFKYHAFRYNTSKNYRCRYPRVSITVSRNPKSKLRIPMLTGRAFSPLWKNGLAPTVGMCEIIVFSFQKIHSNSVHETTVCIIDAFKSCDLPQKEGEEVAGCEPVS